MVISPEWSSLKRIEAVQTEWPRKVIQRDMPEKAIQVVKDESKSGVIPSTQVIKMVLAKIKGSSSFELIEKFRFSLPFETDKER